MADRTAKAVAEDFQELQRVAALLGGTKVLRRKLKSPLDAHEMILEGLPAQSITHLFESLVCLEKGPSLEMAVGMSMRTFQRRKEASGKPLSPEQGGRAWKFAEILAKATSVFGTQHEAEEWLERPAMGLERRRPIDLLATPAGLGLVEEYLGRLEYGTYT